MTFNWTLPHCQSSTALPLPSGMTAPCGYVPLTSPAAIAHLSVSGALCLVVLVVWSLAFLTSMRHALFRTLLRLLMLGGLLLLLGCPLYLAGEASAARCAAQPLLLHAGTHLLYAALLARVVGVYIPKPLRAAHRLRLTAESGTTRYRVAPEPSVYASKEPDGSWWDSAAHQASVALLCLFLADGALFAMWLLVDEPTTASIAVALGDEPDARVELPVCVTGSTLALSLAILLDAVLFACSVGLYLRLRYLAVVHAPTRALHPPSLVTDTHASRT